MFDKKVILIIGLFILAILRLPNIITDLFYFLLYEITNPITVTYTSEFSGLPFMVALFCFTPYMLLLKFGKFTEFGKKFLFYGSLISLLIGVANLSIYTTTTENGITKHYYFMSKEYQWENVNYVYTYVNKQTKSGVNREYTVITKKYELHFKDGSKINVWDNDIDHLYNLHRLLEQKNITRKHSTPFYLIDRKIYSIVKGDKQKIREVLGLDEIITREENIID
ncbi:MULTISPECIES: hypothetical protein [Lysinibacillus]|uniref:Uncharacterized protein n=1 Tax=Lysinibacillus antri TaxID=2498145 RepID=A0A3S0P7L9_9BACI|nr:MULTISPECIES: hypothetical protein [Lysinibacillus]RUL55596.1 hypothetical protein EK386_04530 [Lysinibacillus antri]TSI06680.1 hypothetical protein FJQ64_10050 [Lysinibacillus sp. BW-2-10]